MPNCVKVVYLGTALAFDLNVLELLKQVRDKTTFETAQRESPLLTQNAYDREKRGAGLLARQILDSMRKTLDTYQETNLHVKYSKKTASLETIFPDGVLGETSTDMIALHWAGGVALCLDSGVLKEEAHVTGIFIVPVDVLEVYRYADLKKYLAKRKCRTCKAAPANCSVTHNVCQNCKKAHYCSRACQKADWPMHKPTCM